VLPVGWQERLVAGRAKDLDFVGVMERNSMLRGDVLEQRLRATELVPALRELVRGRMDRLFGGGR
jgi:hypothetical protein